MVCSAVYTIISIKLSLDFFLIDTLNFNAMPPTIVHSAYGLVT